MKLVVLAIGRLKAGPEMTLCADYLERAGKLGRSAGITGVTVLDAVESRPEAEADWLLDKRPRGAFSVVLDGGGKPLTSAGFAALVNSRLGAGSPAMAFLIGGPDGHGANALGAADERLSLGAMTWPHRLCRIMLAEQIYRAVTILVNHPYHRP